MVVRSAAAFHNRFQAIDLAIDIAAQFTQAEHAQRVADLFQELELRHQLGRLVHAGANEDIQHVLHARQVLLDRRRNRLHQLDARRRQGLPGLFHLFVARQ